MQCALYYEKKFSGTKYMLLQRLWNMPNDLGRVHITLHMTLDGFGVKGHHSLCKLQAEGHKLLSGCYL